MNVLFFKSAAKVLQKNDIRKFFTKKQQKIWKYEKKAVYCAMYRNENETYDITDAVVEKALKILLVVCRIKHVKCDKITFSFREFERKFLRRWSEMMYEEYPYNHNSKMAMSTDVSPAKIRYICNN